MKNLKVLFMIAGFSTALVASEGSTDKAMTALAGEYAAQTSANVMNFFKTLGTTVTTKGSEFGTAVSTQASKYANQGSELAKSGYNKVAEKTSEATTVVSGYAQAGYGKTVEALTAGTALAKGGYDSSVTFIQENPKTVGVVATVATVAAAVAAYRKCVYGYVFYQSKK